VPTGDESGERPVPLEWAPLTASGSKKLSTIESRSFLFRASVKYLGRGGRQCQADRPNVLDVGDAKSIIGKELAESPLVKVSR